MALLPLGIWAASGAGGAAIGTDYELISTQILGSAADNITFSSIPQTFKHLQIRMTARFDNGSGTGARNLGIRINGNTGNVYSWHYLNGDGGSVTSGGFASFNHIRFDQCLPSNDQAAGIFGPGIIDIADYASTSKFKTLRGLIGQPVSGFKIGLKSGLYQATSAVSSIVLYDQEYAAGFKAGSRFSLYGLKG